MKTITIDGKEYKIDCNALTYIKYNSFFKRGILQDMQSIQVFVAMQTINKQKIEQDNPEMTEKEIESKLGELMLPYIDEFIDKITKITWILIYSADKKILEYESWLRNIKKFSVNDAWIVEVTEFAVSCFC